MPRSRIITLALIINLLVCGWMLRFYIVDVFETPATYPPFQLGPLTLPPFFHHWGLVWPIGAVLFSLLGLFKHRWAARLALLFAGSFLGMMAYMYAWPYEYDPHRTGGAMPFLLMFAAATLLNVVALWPAFKRGEI